LAVDAVITNPPNQEFRGVFGRQENSAVERRPSRQAPPNGLPRLAGLLPREDRHSDDGHGPGWSVMVAAASFPSTDSMAPGRTSGDGLVTGRRHVPVLLEAALQHTPDVLPHNRRLHP
jgi:hypothetical protein